MNMNNNGLGGIFGDNNCCWIIIIALMMTHHQKIKDESEDQSS